MLPFYYYENTEGGHATGANLKQSAHTAALEYIYLTRKLMDDDQADSRGERTVR
jgi:prolyl oligopeptidase